MAETTQRKPVDDKIRKRSASTQRRPRRNSGEHEDLLSAEFSSMTQGREMLLAWRSMLDQRSHE
jgi:hypothetical protein